MNRHEAYAAERDRIARELGYYLPLEDAASMIKTAHKIVAVISSHGYAVSYKEARLMLKLADQALLEISGGVE